MLNLKRLNRIHLSKKPKVQLFMAKMVLTPNYRLAPVKITLEGLENIPSEPVIFAMNHTDRYNYWPFQFQLWKETGRFTATWVKGKYYENPFVRKFMELVNSIPAVSRGYILTKDFAQTIQREPSQEEYRLLRKQIDHYFWNQTLENSSTEHIPQALLTKKRNMLGREFNPKKETYWDAVTQLFNTMNQRFLELNKEAFEKNLDVLIFPQGTRSTRLSKGHGGISQAALYFNRSIVPVGCSGADQAYPANSPIAKSGNITFRIGKPITQTQMKPFMPEEPFIPFTNTAEKNYHENFQKLVDVVMDRINHLVDEPYQFSQSKDSDGTQGSKRFI